MGYTFPPSDQETAALAALAEDSSPLARVIYHMANRQLAMHEQLHAVQEEVMQMAGNVRRIQSKQTAVVEAMEERGIHVRNGSNPKIPIATVTEGR